MDVVIRVFLSPALPNQLTYLISFICDTHVWGIYKCCLEATQGTAEKNWYILLQKLLKQCLYHNNKAQRKSSYYVRYIACSGITLYALRWKISMGRNSSQF